MQMARLVFILIRRLGVTTLLHLLSTIPPVALQTHNSIGTTDGEESKVKWPGSGPNPGGLCLSINGKLTEAAMVDACGCIEGEAYDNNDPACIANKVNICACVDGYTHCVVSEENCKALNGKKEPYQSHQKLLDEVDVDCDLSTLPKLVLPPIPLPLSALNPNVFSTSNPTSYTSVASNSASASDSVHVDTLESKSSELSTGALIGIYVCSADMARWSEYL